MTTPTPRPTWEAMGQPKYLVPRQVEELRSVSELRKDPARWAQAAGGLHFELDPPPHGLAALTIEFAPRAGDPG